MNARTSIPLLVAMIALAARAAASTPAVPAGAVGGGDASTLFGNMGAFDSRNGQNSEMFSHRAPTPEERAEFDKWYQEAKANEASSGIRVVRLNQDEYAQVFPGKPPTVSVTSNILRQSTMPKPIDQAKEELGCNVYGPPTPACMDLMKAAEEMAKAEAAKDPDQQQLASAENNMWGGSDKSKSGGNEKSGGFSPMSFNDPGDGGDSGQSGDTDGPAPVTPDRPGGDSMRTSGTGGDGGSGDAGGDGYADGSDIGGDSGQIGGDTGAVATGGGDGGFGGRSSGQGGGAGGDARKGPVKVSGNEAVAEHTRKYGDGYTFRAVAQAAETSQRILGEAGAFADEDGRKVRAQEAPPVHYGTMKITAGNGAAGEPKTP